MDSNGVGQAIYGKGPPSPPLVFEAKDEPPRGVIARGLLGLKRTDLRVVSSSGETLLYSRDQSEIPRFLRQILFKTMPEVVAQPLSADAVAAVLRFAKSSHVPAVPRGSASSPFGGSVPVIGGIVIDMSAMDRILEVDPKGRTVTVQAGVRWADLDQELEKHGLRVATCPSSKFSTVAGWVATGGLGLNSFSRGHLSRNVLAVELATPDGNVKRYSQADKEFALIFGSEGQLGVITSVTIEAAEKQEKGRPHLVMFDDVKSALSFAHSLAGSAVKPAHIAYESASRLTLIDRALGGMHFRVAEAILVSIEGEESEKAFAEFLSKSGLREEKDYLARYLWNERFFPMKVRRFGPGMLGAEVVMPLRKLPAGIESATRLASAMDVEPLFEVHFLQNDEALMLCFFTVDQGNTIGYTLNAFKSLMIGRALIDLGARPYSIGIWNNMLADAEDASRVKQLRALKAALDPTGVMNPGKYFALSGRFGRLGGLAFSPALMGPLLRTVNGFHPLSTSVINSLSAFARRKLNPERRTEVLRTADECAMCGACVSVCPAYLIVGDERVTARGKLFTARAIAAGTPITREHAHRIFLCMRCKACEQVCQSKLELIPVYEKLEAQLEAVHGKDAAEMDRFVKFAEASPGYEALINRGLVIGAPKHGMGGGTQDV